MKYSGAVAVVEVAGLPTAIACADAMVKAANVTLIGYEITKGGPGLVNVKICGDVGAVQAAVDAGCAVANEITQVFSRVIMPRPHTDLEKILLNKNADAFFTHKFNKAQEVKTIAEVKAREEAKAAEEEVKALAEAKAREEAKLAEEAKGIAEAKAREETKAVEETKTDDLIVQNNETDPTSTPVNNNLPKRKHK